MRAWYVPASDPDAPAILYLHGSRWNLNDSVFRIERWASMGYSILAIDYRGFGASSPRLPSQTSTVEDAIAGLKELARRHPSSTSRFVYGHSMGGAVAAALAAQPHRPEFAGLILESTFTSIRDMIAVTAWAKVPGLPLLVTQPFDSATALRSSREPVLLLHGTADRVVPHTMSDALYAAAQTAPFRKLVKIEGASHSGASSSRDYREAVQQFVNEAASPQQADEKRTVRPDQIKGKPL